MRFFVASNLKPLWHWKFLELERKNIIKNDLKNYYYMVTLILVGIGTSERNGMFPIFFVFILIYIYIYSIYNCSLYIFYIYCFISTKFEHSSINTKAFIRNMKCTLPKIKPTTTAARNVGQISSDTAHIHTYIYIAYQLISFIYIIFA